MCKSMASLQCSSIINSTLFHPDFDNVSIRFNKDFMSSKNAFVYIMIPKKYDKIAQTKNVP